MNSKPILFITDGNFLSHLLRCIEIARVLRSMGEKVVFAASGRYIKLLHSQGFTIHPVFTNDPDHTMKATRASMMKYYDQMLIVRSIFSEVECLRTVNPKVVVGDFRWTLKISAEYCGIPFVSIINTLWTPYYGLRRSIPEQLHIRKFIGKKMCELLGPWLKEKVLVKRGKPFMKMRNQLGISPLKNLNHEMCGDLNLMPDIPELFPTLNLPEHFKYIGPLYAGDTSLPVPDNPHVPDKPFIYITLGSTATPRLISLLFKAFESLDIPIVMTTGKQPVTHPVPNNFILMDYLSARQAYKNAQLVVCHGGHGTLYQALSYGKPIIGIATHNDQQWNLDRIQAEGLGLQFNEKTCTPETLKNAYINMVSGQSFANNAIRFKTILERYDAPSIAANEIIRFAHNPLMQYATV